MRTMRSRQLVRGVVVLAALGLTAAACSTGGSTLDIGFRRVALDLAFKDPEKAEPVDARRVVRQVVGERVAQVSEQPAPRRRTRVVVVPAREPEPVCETAPEGVTPERPAFHRVKGHPRPGVYERHNEGTIQIQIATQNLELPYPSRTEWEIRDLREVKESKYLNSDDVDDLDPPDAARDQERAFPPLMEFTLTRNITRNTKVTDTYRYTYTDETGGDYLYLVKRVTLADGVETVFNPTPPIRYVALNEPEGPDSAVNFGGVDRERNMAMVVQSEIIEREWVDVCGEVLDTYRVRIQERIVDFSVTPPEVSGNEGDSANFWNIQFDNGLLIVREEVHTTLRTTTEIAGAPVPVVVQYDYVSTLDDTEAEPFEEEDAG